MELMFTDETQTLSQDLEKLILDILNYAADVLELTPDTEMSVTIVDDQTIKEINAKYRNKDQATDVISFAIEDEVDENDSQITALMQEFLPRNLGDIFISLDHAKEQAEEYGHSLERELGFLAVHGFLHLNGYDHMEPIEEKEMFALQRKILDDYGLQR